MSSRTINLTEELHTYLIDNSIREPELLTRLRKETAEDPASNMQISPEQGQFMRLLVKMLGVKKAIEVGVFTGYSSLSVAMSLPEDGKLIACDVDEGWTSVAKRYWKEARQDHKIKLILAPAIDTLKNLIEQGQSGTFDYMFVDADKVNYHVYYELGLKLVRQGGVILFDNTLWSGRVIDPQVNDENTEAIRVFNKGLKIDSRIDLSLVPIGDGLTICLKL